MKREALQSRKFKKLMALTGYGKALSIGVLEGIWLFAQSNCPRGDIGRVSNEDIALDLDIPPNEIDRVIDALVCSGWLDEDQEHRLLVHDWPTHCLKSIHNLLARNKQVFANGEAPNLTGLGKYRKAAEAFYGDEAPAEEQETVERGGSGSASTPYAKIVKAWNDMASEAGLPQVQQITDKRKAAMRTRWADENWRKLYKAALPMIPGSDFLCGRKQGSDWRASLDWMLRPDSAAKVVEGMYSDSKPKDDTPMNRYEKEEEERLRRLLE